MRLLLKIVFAAVFLWTMGMPNYVSPGLGNIAMSGYVLIQLLGLKSDALVSTLELRTSS